MPKERDIQILRDLAKKYRDVCDKEVQDERRDLWRKHNSFVRTRPLINVQCLAAAWHEAPESKLECEDPFYRGHEDFLRRMIFQDSIGDDCIMEPWITQRASIVLPPNGHWGVRIKHIPSPDPGGAWKPDPPIKKLEDLSNLVEPRHVINEEATARNIARLQDAVGDILEVNVDRSPAYCTWHGDPIHRK